MQYGGHFRQKGRDDHFPNHRHGHVPTMNWANSSGRSFSMCANRTGRAWSVYRGFVHLPRQLRYVWVSTAHKDTYISVDCKTQGKTQVTRIR
jgi:hypothetical protein